MNDHFFLQNKMDELGPYKVAGMIGVQFPTLSRYMQGYRVYEPQRKRIEAFIKSKGRANKKPKPDGRAAYAKKMKRLKGKISATKAKPKAAKKAANRAKVKQLPKAARKATPKVKRKPAAKPKAKRARKIPTPPTSGTLPATAAAE